MIPQVYYVLTKDVLHLLYGHNSIRKLGVKDQNNRPLTLWVGCIGILNMYPCVISNGSNNGIKMLSSSPSFENIGSDY